MNFQERFYPESKFGGFTDIDGTVAFYIRVQSLLGSESIVLDVGCGRGSYADDPVILRREVRNLRGRVRKVIGIDVDKAAETNPLEYEYPCL